MSHSFDDTDDDHEEPTFIAVQRNELVNVEFDDENVSRKKDSTVRKN